LIEKRLRDNITSGIFKEGELIPTERELSQKYGVSHGTVRRAALSLKQKGLLYRVQGRGTSVVFQEYNRRRFRNYRFVECPGQDLVTVTLAPIDLKVAQANGDIAHYLKIRNGTKVIRLERIGRIAEEFLLHTVSFLPKRLYKGLEKYTAEQFVKNTLWKIQEIHFGISIEKKDEFVSVIPADEEMAQTLEVDVGSPLFRIEATMTSSVGKVIEYRLSHCNIGHMRFCSFQEIF